MNGKPTQEGSASRIALFTLTTVLLISACTNTSSRASVGYGYGAYYGSMWHDPYPWPSGPIYVGPPHHLPPPGWVPPGGPGARPPPAHLPARPMPPPRPAPRR